VTILPMVCETYLILILVLNSPSLPILHTQHLLPLWSHGKIF
jgi:hypothetical protein